MDKFKNQAFKHEFVLLVLEEMGRTNMTVPLDEYQIAIYGYNYAMDHYKEEYGSVIIYLRAIMKLNLIKFYSQSGYKFVFSKNNMLLDLELLDSKEKSEYLIKVSNEIDVLNEMLKPKKVSYSKISLYSPRKEEDRNYLLNVVMVIINEGFLINHISRHNKLPLKRLSLYGNLRLDFIERYSRYVIVYSTLFSNDELLNLISYIGIEVDGD